MQRRASEISEEILLHIGPNGLDLVKELCGALESGSLNMLIDTQDTLEIARLQGQVRILRKIKNYLTR